MESGGLTACGASAIGRAASYFRHNEIILNASNAQAVVDKIVDAGTLVLFAIQERGTCARRSSN